MSILIVDDSVDEQLLLEKRLSLLGGDISAKSTYGRGSELSFIIPVKLEL